MRLFLTITACLTIVCSDALQAQGFGNAPRDEAALAMSSRVADVYSKQGIKPALQLLDTEGRVFMKKSGALPRYDFFAALSAEATAGNGKQDPAWALALTEWCYHYCRTVGDEYWFQNFGRDLHLRYFDAGNYGAARAVIDREQARELERGRDLNVSHFPAKGAVHKDFPAIAKRTVGEGRRIDNKQIKNFLSRSQQDMAEGKWRPAMEAAALLVEQCTNNFQWHQSRSGLTDSAMMKESLTGNLRTAATVMAEGWRFLELPGMEMKELLELTQFNPKAADGMLEMQMAKARLLQLKHQQGGKDVAGILKELNEIRALLLAEDYQEPAAADRVSLMIADVQFREKNVQRGWEILDEIRAKKNLSRDLRYQVDMEWCRHRVDTASYTGVEDVLVNLLKIAREGGLKQREIALYDIYARLLTGLERFDDALFIQNELIRLLKSFDLFTRVPRALHQLARIHARMGQSSAAKASISEARHLLDAAKMPDAAKNRARTVIDAPLPDVSDRYKAIAASTDLQPLRALSVPLEGLPARGLFTLTNLANVPVEGELSFQGAGLVLRETTGSLLVVDVSQPGGKDSVSRAITLGANSFFVIDFSRQVAATEPAIKVNFQWKPKNGKEQSALWKAEQAEKGVSLAVTDAGEYLDNPFYLIPIYHLLQYKDTFAQVADMRVVASQPARIELYDDKDELVFVDADGDGAFTSEGDIISKDMNQNGIGDMTLAEKTQEMRFRMFVRPAQMEPGKDIKLNLQLFQGGEWITYATDQLQCPVADQ